MPTVSFRANGKRVSFKAKQKRSRRVFKDSDPIGTCKRVTNRKTGYSIEVCKVPKSGRSPTGYKFKKGTSRRSR